MTRYKLCLCVRPYKYKRMRNSFYKTQQNKLISGTSEILQQREKS